MPEEKIIQKLIEHDERFKEIKEEMATKSDTKTMIDTLEDVATRVKRIDEDRVFTYQ